MFIALNLTKAVQLDKSLITKTRITTTTTTTTKSILRPLLQYLLAVKNLITSKTGRKFKIALANVLSQYMVSVILRHPVNIEP